MEVAQQSQAANAAEEAAASRGMLDPVTSSSPSNPLESYGPNRKGSCAGIFLLPRILLHLFPRHLVHAVAIVAGDPSVASCLQGGKQQ